MLPLTVATRTEKTADGRVKVSPVASPAIPILIGLLIFGSMVALTIWVAKKQLDITQQAIATGNPAIVAAAEAPMIIGGLTNMFNRARV